MAHSTLKTSHCVPGWALSSVPVVGSQANSGLRPAGSALSGSRQPGTEPQKPGSTPWRLGLGMTGKTGTQLVPTAFCPREGCQRAVPGLRWLWRGMRPSAGAPGVQLRRRGGPSATGCPCAPMPPVVWPALQCHPAGRGTQGADTFAALAFPSYLSSKVSEPTQSASLFTGRICQPV